MSCLPTDLVLLTEGLDAFPSHRPYDELDSLSHHILHFPGHSASFFGNRSTSKCQGCAVANCKGWAVVLHLRPGLHTFAPSELHSDALAQPARIAPKSHNPSPLRSI